MSLDHTVEQGGRSMNTDVRTLGRSWSPKHGNTDIQVREALRAAAELPASPPSSPASQARS
jgi:hypothetical protein